MTPIGPTNIELAEALEQMAEVLVRQGESNPYRVQAYLQAAGMIREYPRARRARLRRRRAARP